ncbi:hypothetical protein D9758_015314 [Tetrapyrgos nigripes]|uniref:Zn(2)-C6 fungal-type domain-containing protein n=1 Tax=Tetrapyrgos nigripes TaxID=182062 RepID=A0A8H5CDG8_9AGAR|nr:hypothetical protein D9758_015314 [Tetrapyrgos nigripes]
MSELPVKKRRLQNACDECRKRKMKCDSANMPNNICSNCISFQSECTHVMASSKKKRGPPKGTPKGTRTLASTIAAILSPAKPYPIPEDQEALRQLLVDLASHIISLEGQLEELIQDRSQPRSPSQPQANAASSSTQDNPTDANSPSDSDANDARSLPLWSFPISTSPPQRHGPKEEGISGLLKRLLLDEQADRDGLHALSLVQATKDFQEEVKIEEEELASFKRSASSFSWSSLSQSSRRPEIWAIHPWQILPEEHLPQLQFPDDDLLPQLIDLYFAHMNRYLPLLHRPSFDRAVADGVHLRDRQFGYVVLAVCAYGARYSNDPRIYYDNSRHEYSIGWKWFKQIKLIKSNFAKAATIYDLQLCVIAVMFLESTSTPEACWILTSLGLRLAQDVAAHRRRPGQPTFERELWKRAFWALYIIDAFVSAFMGKPRATSADDFDVDLPIECGDEYWETEDPEQAFKQPPGTVSYMSAWITFVKLLDIMSTAQRTIYAVRRSDFWTAIGMSGPEWTEKVVSELDSLLNKWIDSVPDHLKWDPNNPNPVFFHQSVMLYTSYYWVQIIVHKPFIPKPGSTPDVSFPSMAICANAARSCCHVMEVLHFKRGGFLPMPNVIMALHNSAVVLLLNVWRGKHSQISLDTEKEMMDVYKCIDVICAYETRWQSAGTYIDILRELISITNLRSNIGTQLLQSSRKRLRDLDSDQQTSSQSGSQTQTTSSPSNEPSASASDSSAHLHQYGHLQDSHDFQNHSQRPQDDSESTPTIQSRFLLPHSGSQTHGAESMMFNLPMHSAELGSLPLHESFDLFQDQGQGGPGPSSSSSLQAHTNSDFHPGIGQALFPQPDIRGDHGANAETWTNMPMDTMDMNIDAMLMGMGMDSYADSCTAIFSWPGSEEMDDVADATDHDPHASMLLGGGSGSSFATGVGASAQGSQPRAEGYESSTTAHGHGLGMPVIGHVGAGAEFSGGVSGSYVGADSEGASGHEEQLQGSMHSRHIMADQSSSTIGMGSSDTENASTNSSQISGSTAFNKMTEAHTSQIFCIILAQTGKIGVGICPI